MFEVLSSILSDPRQFGPTLFAVGMFVLIVGLAIRIAYAPQSGYQANRKEGLVFFCGVWGLLLIVVGVIAYGSAYMWPAEQQIERARQLGSPYTTGNR